jgi:hypothetical protein
MPDKAEGEAGSREKGDHERQSTYSKDMKVVAITILIMGVSLAIVAILYVIIGHIGPSFSSSVMSTEQSKLRTQYGLPSCNPVPKDMLEVPPSLRNITNPCQK